MNDKKKAIMEAGITLFATKGFSATSIQEIADKSGISKGAFYLHFRSKDELKLFIFQYYLEKIQQKIAVIEQSDFSPRDKLQQQLVEQLRFILKNKEVLVLQFREQMLYMNKDIEQFFKKISSDRLKWYETRFLALYGESVRAYLSDITRLFDGMLNAYLKLMIKHDIPLDVKQFVAFILRRLDNVVNGMLIDQEAPILTQEMLALSINKKDSKNEAIAQILSDIETEVTTLDIDRKWKKELMDTLHFLKLETQKGELKSFVFKGMLGNFDEVKELHPHIKRLRDLLSI